MRHESHHARAAPLRDLLGPRSVVIATAAAGVAVIVMLVTNETSLWLDEAVSAALARLGWDDFWAIVSEREANMSLYFGALKVWIAVGDGEFWMRTLSVLASLGTIALTYSLGRRIAGRGVAAGATLVVAVNGLFLSEGPQIRGYALAALLVVASCYFFVTAIQDGWRWAWAAYALTAGLSLYVHVFAGLVILGQLVSLAWGPRPAVRWGRVIAAMAGMALLSAAMVAFALFEGGQIGWIGEPTLSKTVGTFVVMAGGLAGGRARAAPDQALGLGLAAIYALGFVLALAETRRRGTEPGHEAETWGLRFLLSVTVIPVVVAFAVSIAAQPIFYYKYFAVIVPMLAILVAVGLTRVRRAGVAISLTAALLVLSLVAIGRCAGGCNREDWADVARHVETRVAPGDAVMFYAPYVRTAFDYYAEELAADIAYPQVPYTSPIYEESVGDPRRDLVTELVGDYERIWLVSSHANIVGDFPGSRLVSWLTDSYGSARETSFKGVRVLLFGD